MAREYTREIYLYINDKEISNNVKSIKKEMNELVNKQAQMIIGSQEYVESTKKIKTLRAVLNEHNASLREVDNSWGAAMNRIGDQFNRFQTLGMAVIGATVGIIAGFMKTAEAANLFEERLDNLSALTGLNGKELEWLGEKAKETSISITQSGVRIKQSATDILDAYTKMGSQRPELLKDKEALAAVTEAAIVLSEAGKMELEPATAALATTMNQFNLEARDANRIINTIAAGSKVGAGEIPYLTEVIEKSGTTANLMGISIEQMVGTIEAIAPKFAEARRAGTALDRVFLKMREKGIGMKDGVFDLNRAIDELRIRFAQGESSAALFGVEQSKMGEILVMNQGDMNRYSGEVTNTSIAFEQAGKNTDNMAARLAQAKNKVTLMYQEIGTKLAPAVIHSTNAFNYFLKAIMAMPKFVKENQMLVVALAGAILALSGVQIKNIAVSLWDTAVRIKSAIATRASASARALEAEMTMVQATQTKTLTIWQRTATTLQWAWNAALAANPVGLVIAGITALVLALMYFSKNSKENLALEASKKTLTEDLTTANNALKVSYDEIGQQIGNLNQLSVQEKLDLDDKIAKTLALAEAELEVLTARRSEIKISSTKIKAGQFVTHLFNPEKLKELARANALEAVAPIDALLEAQRDRINSLKAQKTELNDVLQAEDQADHIGTGSISELDVKLQKYGVALKNVVKGGEDYIRIQKKIKQVEADLAKGRGSEVSPDGGKFDRTKALADLEKFHSAQLLIIKEQYAKGLIEKQRYEELIAQEDIRFQKASADRMKASGQDETAELIKIQDTLIAIKEEKDKEYLDLMKSLDQQTGDMYKSWDAEDKDSAKTIPEDPQFSDARKQKILEWQYWLETNAEGQKEKLKRELADNIISLTEYNDKVRALDKETAEKKLQNLERWATIATGVAETVSLFMQAQKDRELAEAGKDDKKKEAIEKKYAKRQQDIATVQAVIEGALEIARINSNAGVNADLTQTLRLILTGLAVARTAGTIAVIKSQQFAEGKYPDVSTDTVLSPSIQSPSLPGMPVIQTLQFADGKYPDVSADPAVLPNSVITPLSQFPSLPVIPVIQTPQFAEGKYPDDSTEPGVSSSIPVPSLPGIQVIQSPQFTEGKFPDDSTDHAVLSDSVITPLSQVPPLPGMPVIQTLHFAEGKNTVISTDTVGSPSIPASSLPGLPVIQTPQFAEGKYPDDSTEPGGSPSIPSPSLPVIPVIQSPQFAEGKYPEVPSPTIAPDSNPVAVTPASPEPQTIQILQTRLLKLLGYDPIPPIPVSPKSPDQSPPIHRQYAKGKYPVMGADDKRIYQATILGKVRTGLYKTPTLGLFSEKEPEIVIDGPTTRRIRANFPQILNAIQSVRVNQYSTGMYPNPEGNASPTSGGLTPLLQKKDSRDIDRTASDTSIQIAALLQANMQMMRQVILSHEKPGTVSFKSIRDTQAEFDFIKSKTTLS